MYYVENTRYNTTKTIGCCITKKYARELIEKEKERMKRKGIKVEGEFTIRNEGLVLNNKLRVKSKKNTYAMMK